MIRNVFKMDETERCGNSMCSFEIKSVSDSSNVTNEKKQNLETDEM